MKTLITIIFLTWFSVIAYSGIDEMKERDKKIKDKDEEQEAPIDSHILFLASLVVVYGGYMVYKDRYENNKI